MNFYKLLKQLSFVAVILAFSVGSLFAQTYVSATNGDDNFGTGSQATPYRSIQKAINSAATGSTIYVEAGVYDAGVIPTEGNPVTLAAARSFTFIGTAVGGNTSVTITNGFTLNHASAVVDFQTSGTAVFNFGTTATALVLSAGTMNIATSNVVLGSGATLTIGNGLLNALPTVGANLNVTFNGTNAVASTAAYLPSSLGTGTLTVNKATGTLTVDNTTLSANAITIASNPNVTFNGSVAIAANGDITHGGTGTLTIGNDASSTLTMSSTTALGSIIVNAGGTLVVNSNVTYNIKNVGTSATVGDSPSLTVGNAVALTGASNLTINGNLTFNNTNVASSDGKNAVRHNVTLSNAGTGALSIVGTLATPLSGTSFSAPTGGNNNSFIDVIFDNASSGSFSVRTAATRGATGTNGVINDGGGSMTLGQSGDTFSTSYDVVNGSGAATEVMTVNATATFGGTVTTVNAASLLEFTANASIAGAVTHAGKMKINSNTITLSGTGGAMLIGAGDIYSTTTATTGSGWIKFTGDAPTSTYTGNLPNVEVGSKTTFSLAGNVLYGDLKTSGAAAITIAGGTDVKGNLDENGSGTITINGATTVRGNVTMTAGNITMGTNNLTVEGTFTMPQGTFTFGANTLTLKGNFVRTGGTINAAAAGTGTLTFAGATSQSFTPGTQMNVFNVVVANTGSYLANVIEDDKVTITASLIVLRDFDIQSGQVVLGTSNIRMQQANLGAPVKSARFTNGGRGYTASGVGGLIFEGDGANVVGGTPNDGAVITGAQPYSNIYIRLSVQANNVFTLGAVKISGKVTFDGGGINVGAPADGADAFNTSTLTLDNTLVVPTVVINTQNTHGSPYFVTNAPAVTTVYNLTYTGQTGVTIGASDFVSGKVNDLTLSAGSAGKTITFIAGNGTITGALTVDNGETLQLTNGGARTLTASGNSSAHVVNGSVLGGTLEITGNAASLTGGSGTGNASEVANLTVDPASTGTFTSNGMKDLGNVIINKAGLVSTITMNSANASITTFTNTAGTTTLNMNSTVSGIGGNFIVTANSVNLTMNGGAAGTRTIAGQLQVNGGSLTLGSHINVTGATTLTGSVVLGDYNLTLANALTHTGTGTVTAGSGAVIAAGAGVNYTFTTAVDIPNFTLNSGGTITLVTNGLNVTNKFVHTAGALDLNSLPLTISGDTYTYTVGTYPNTGGAATGVVNLTGSALTVTAAANPAYEYVNVNSTGTVTFATSDNTTPTARTFGVSKAFTHTKGNVALGINDIDLTGAAAAYNTAATAGTVTGTATGANLGEIVLTGAASVITLSDNYSIQNLKIAGASSKNDNKVLTVSDNLTLGANFTFTNSARLVLGDGATIVRSAGVFDQTPTFGTTVNVTYSPAGALNSDKEIPAASNALNNLTITSGAPVITANTTVNGTLFLTGGTISTGTKTLTIAEGATINRSGGAFAAAATDVPTVTTYKLVYSGGAALTIGKEFVSSTSAVTSLTVSMTANGVLVNADRTVGSLTMSPSGAGAANVYLAVGTDAATKTLTVAGPTTINNGIVSTQDATAANSTNRSTLAAQGSVIVNGGNLGNLGTDNAAGVDGGLDLSFNGTSGSQLLTLNGNTSFSNITLAASGTNPVVKVSGGNLTITNLLTFTNGILDMTNGGTEDRKLILPNPTGASNSGLAYNRDGVTGTNVGHVVGKIQRAANTNDGSGGTNGRFQFPVGTLDGQYRPAFISFTPSYVVGVPTNIVVSHQDSSPAGSVGLGDKTYPDFYWLIATTPQSFAPTQGFDLDLQANNIGVPFTDEELIRIIRRQDGNAETNEWEQQGSDNSYSNYIQVEGTDSLVVVRTTSSSGGLIEQGSRFTLGVPTTAPEFTAPAAPLTLTAAENVTSTVQFTADPKGVNGTVTYTVLAGAPEWLTINATSGLVTFALADKFDVAGEHDFTVRATDNNGLTTDLVAKVTVSNTNQPPVFTTVLSDSSINNGVAFSFTYVATDGDGDDLTYSLVSGPTGVAVTAAGVLSWTPTYAQVGNSYNVEVKVKDAADSASTTASVTVVSTRKRGDTDGDGSVLALDASLDLRITVGLDAAPAAGTEDFYGADANADGAIGSIDASWVLYYAVNDKYPDDSMPKNAIGNVELASAQVESNDEELGQLINLPVKLEKSSNVLSTFVNLYIDETLADVEYVNANTPKGSIMMHNYENGVLKVAIAGIEAMDNGNIVNVGIRLKDKESVLDVHGFAKLNGNVDVTFDNVSVRQVPAKFELSSNYPNPFNPTTNIKYQITENTQVKLVVYNMLGEVVKTVVNNVQEAGFYTAKWDGTNDYGSRVTSGVYIYRLQAGSFIATKKMNLIK